MYRVPGEKITITITNNRTYIVELSELVKKDKILTFDKKSDLIDYLDRWLTVKKENSNVRD